jgi:hypothetical protein
MIDPPVEPTIHPTIQQDAPNPASASEAVILSAMPDAIGKWRYAVAGTLAVVLVLVIAVGWIVLSASDEVLGETFVGPVDASGLTEQQLATALGELAVELEDRERIFAVEGTSFGLFGDQAGLAIAQEVAIEKAMAVGRSSFWETIRSSIFRPTNRVDLDLTLDPAAVASLVEVWNQDLTAPFEGEIQYSAGGIRLDPPRPGVAIEEAGLGAVLLAGFEGSPEDLTVLATRAVEPSVSPARATEAVALAEALVADTITLRSVDPVVAIDFTPEQIGNALTSIPGTGPGAAVSAGSRCQDHRHRPRHRSDRTKPPGRSHRSQPRRQLDAGGIQPHPPHCQAGLRGGIRSSILNSRRRGVGRQRVGQRLHHIPCMLSAAGSKHPTDRRHR